MTEKFKEPAYNQIFVFGSNLAGIHGAGAAKTAYEKYGATWGKGVGLSNRSYALPTKDADLKPLPLNEIAKYVIQLLVLARSNPTLRFFVTRVGCGLAGYTESDIRPMFLNAPKNCELPEGWRDFKP